MLLPTGSPKVAPIAVVAAARPNVVGKRTILALFASALGKKFAGAFFVATAKCIVVVVGSKPRIASSAVVVVVVVGSEALIVVVGSKDGIGVGLKALVSKATSVVAARSNIVGILTVCSFCTPALLEKFAWAFLLSTASKGPVLSVVAPSKWSVLLH